MNAPLTPAEARRVQRYHDRLMRALQERDRAALRHAKQRVLAAAYTPRRRGITPALRQALRELAWRMAGLLPARRW
ncbi:hypothetical protein [Acidovorax sp. MR-S7]|jgi:hypothetical protein|uniref:hypothetical protein n=1 Tax=unclassified Acidovorax TaxID=2684926 RepID=UPI000371006A|nr:hypothetical protein [Acidovorax sp. MR-S7]GAD24426.1 acetyl/propionyl-CoA carboxylase, alpha subunit [Acidovorax sp. MR-S7]